ncbi:hypothetical protein DSO57_1019452 [Entomophthora muscae]|uniref:Uncharacterized protein n=1 Tax=Entomophthora muscae TaxID=34485 RepID=A0ACC2RV72_9FUNG|nr:hypothetical protein DSO57_1019452 [Entomophthora muscae]
MTDREREFIGNEFNRLPTEGLAPAEVQVHGGDAYLVIGKVLEEFVVMQTRYKLLEGHLSLLENVNSSKPVPGYDPGHTLGTGVQELHSTCPFIYRQLSKIFLDIEEFGGGVLGGDVPAWTRALDLFPTKVNQPGVCPGY